LMKEKTKAKQNPTGWTLWWACVFVYLICRNGLSLLLLLCFVVDKNGRAECTPSYLLHDFILLHPRFHCSSRSLPPNPQSLATNTVIYVMNFFFLLLFWQPKTSSPWMGGSVLSSSGPSYSTATLQLCSSSWVHTRHTSLQEDPTRYYPKEKNTKSATSSKFRAHTIPPKKSKPTKAQSNAKPKTFLLLKKEEVRCKGSSSYIYKQYYWTPQEAEAVVLYYWYDSYELSQAAPITSCLQMQTCHTLCNSRAPSSFPSNPDEEEHSSCPCGGRNAD
jgi:hypothetical protein